MQLTVNIRSNVAVYVQIENQIRFAIAACRLKPGDRLPSVRDLSDQTQVNPNTVAKSYRDLEVMGLVYTRHGMGVYIADGAQTKCKKACRKMTVERIFEAVQEGKSAGMSKAELAVILNASYAHDATPYAEAPKNVATMAG